MRLCNLLREFTFIIVTYIIFTYARCIKITKIELLSSHVRTVSRKSLSQFQKYSARIYNLRTVESVDRKMSKSRNAECSNGNDFGSTRVKCSGSCSTKAFRYWQTIITFHEQSRAIYSFLHYVLRLFDFSIARERTRPFL